MIWLFMALLALAALAPLAWALRRPAALRDRRAADLALYRAQLAELEAEAAAGRLDAEALAAARLEVQRRLLATPAAEAAAPGEKLSPRLLAPLLALPLVALGLYLLVGSPGMPSAPWAERRAMMQRDENLLAQLRARVAQLPPSSEQARQGWVLLGNAERNRGNLDGAIEGYDKALLIRFDPDTTAQLAQVLLEADRAEDAAALLTRALPQAPQHIGLRFLAGAAELRAGRTDAAKALWQALVAEAPDDAPWKAMVQRRLNELP